MNEDRSAFLSRDVSPPFRQAVLLALALFALQAIVVLITFAARGAFPLLPLALPIVFGGLWAIFFQEAGKEGASGALLVAWLVLAVFVVISPFHASLVYVKFSAASDRPQLSSVALLPILISDVIVVIASLRALVSAGVSPLSGWAIVPTTALIVVGVPAVTNGFAAAVLCVVLSGGYLRSRGVLQMRLILSFMATVLIVAIGACAGIVHVLVALGILPATNPSTWTVGGSAAQMALVSRVLVSAAVVATGTLLVERFGVKGKAVS